MALSKEIESNNGVVTNYHRIMSINTITNKEIQIFIYSYLNVKKRLEENTETEEEIFNVISSEMVIKEYEEDFDVKKGYKYLKTLDKYKNAENC